MQYVIGNWKMHETVPQAVALAGKLEDGLDDLALAGKGLPEVIVCPPFTALSAVGDILNGRTIVLGAQNCHWADEGAHTGEISAPLLKELVRFVLIGHSERREEGETDELVARKLAAVVRAGLTPVLCVGEKEPTPEAARHAAEEVKKGLAEVDPSVVQSLIVAYEPVWAVGTGKPAQVEHVREVITHLKDELDDLGLDDVPVLYGGSVTKENAESFTEIDNLDGLLVGGASLDEKAFISIVNAAADHE